MKTKQLLFVVLVFGALSCHNIKPISPAGFWTNYHANLIIKKSSDQGPMGGFREIHWKNNIPNTFTSKDVIDFAYKNGWSFTDSVSFNDLEKIKNDVAKSYNDYSDEIVNTVPLTWRINYILRFKTGWIAVKPGNSKDTNRNGFVGINADGTELYLYHLWGE